MRPIVLVVLMTGCAAHAAPRGEEFEQVLARLRATSQEEPPSVEHLIARARRADWEASEILAMKCLQLDPACAEAWAILFQHHWIQVGRQGAFIDAVHWMELEPDDRFARLAYAESLPDEEAAQRRRMTAEAGSFALGKLNHG